MGRVLEALKQAPGPRGPEEEAGPRLQAVVPEPEPAEESDDDPSMPFIEVGPRRSLIASPDVLASVAAAALPTGPPPGVAFRPLGGRSSPDRPALAPELVAFHDPDHAVSGQYRDLLARLLTALPGVRHQALLFMPVRPEFDGAAVLLNVAITAARQGRRRVLVVEGNLRRPDLAARLGLTEVPGLREALAGTALEEVVRATEQPNLLALPAGAAEHGPGLRVVTETMRSLLRLLRQRFDLVLVNGPAWQGRADGALLAGVCDAVYLVLPEGEAETPAVDELLQEIPRHGARLAGCILAG